MTAHELNRHLTTARNITQIIIPNINPTNSSVQLLKYLDPNIIKSNLKLLSENITWEMVFQDINRIKNSQVIYTDVHNKHTSINLFDFNYKYGLGTQAAPLDQIYLIASGDGKFSKSAIKASAYSNNQACSLTIKPCDNTPLIEIESSAKERYESKKNEKSSKFEYTGLNEMSLDVPGLPVLSSSIVCNVVYNVGT